MGQDLKKSRLRDFGVRIGGFDTGPFNAVTDVAGVRVGHVTLERGDGRLVVGEGPVRTGVTAIIPAAGDLWNGKLAAGSFVLNGTGEATGLMWVQESGILENPILFTNTLSVSTAHVGLLEWMMERYPQLGISDDTPTPMVLECDDSTLNDSRGMHVKPGHVWEALALAESAAGAGPVPEGCVGAGTGMMTYDFKGGIGTSSRRLPADKGGYTVGVILNSNHGRRHNLRIDGHSVGRLIPDLMPTKIQEGSITVVVATDAPCDSRQLSRLAKRAMLGVGRTGGIAYHGSGDVAVAFSTANRIPHYPDKAEFTLRSISDFWMNDLFEAAADCAEEAVLNSMLAAKTVVGRDGNTAHALPHERLEAILGLH
ncbi:MAG: Peptidase [Pseudomonadota bacterium]